MLNASCQKLENYDDSSSQTKEGKSGTDIVTEADRQIQQYIVQELQEEFPQTGVIAEEQHDLDEEATNFIIDPVDGTTNLDRGSNYYSVSIAYQNEDGIVAGGIASPYHENGLISLAVEGEGAFFENNYSFDKNAETLMTPKNRIETKSEEKSLEEAVGMIEATPVNDIEDQMSEIRKEVTSSYRQPGSAALELVEIARGTLDFRIDTIDIWDYAAGHLIVEESGAKTQSTPIHSNSIDRDLDFTIAAKDGIADEIQAKVEKSSNFLNGKPT